MKKALSYIVFLMLVSLNASAANYTFDTNKGLVFSWKYGDVVGVYTAKGTRIKHWASAPSTDDDKTYSFSSHGWSLVDGSRYYLYSPYDASYFEKGIPITELPISFDGQKQSENHSLAHIAAYDYMMGEGKAIENSADFTLKHLCAVVRIVFVSPKSAIYNKIALETTDGIFCRKAEMNLETQSISVTSRSSSASLALDHIDLEEGDTLEAYMVVAPVDLSGHDVKLTITSDDEEEIDFDVQMNELKAGKLYMLNTTECEEKAISAKRRVSSLTEPYISAYDIPIDTDSEIIVTGINQAMNKQVQDNEAIYTLSGIRTRQSSAKGVIIKNGKKCLSHRGRN